MSGRNAAQVATPMRTSLLREASLSAGGLNAARCLDGRVLAAAQRKERRTSAVSSTLLLQLVIQRLILRWSCEGWRVCDTDSGYVRNAPSHFLHKQRGHWMTQNVKSGHLGSAQEQELSTIMHGILMSKLKRSHAAMTAWGIKRERA